MKTLLAIIASVLVLAAAVHTTASTQQHKTDHQESDRREHFFQHGAQEDQDSSGRVGDVMHSDNESVTVSIAQNDFDLCTDPFYIGFYEITRQVYAVGIENVTVAALEDKTFSYIRSQAQFTPQQAEGWIEHIKAIPGQLVMIIREDPAVLDSCANFSVALVGPP